MGTRLRKLILVYSKKKLSDGKTIGGKGRLTDSLIDKLAHYYGNAIRCNSTSVKEMRKAIWAVWGHSCSTDDEPMHWFCPTNPNTWCKYNAAINNNLQNYKHKPSVAKAVRDVIKPVFADLSHPALLKKCLGGKTQNPNESLNSLIWKFCPKTIGSRFQIAEIAANLETSVFNDGNQILITILEKFGLKINRNVCVPLAERDNRRIFTSRQRLLESTLKLAEPRKLKKKERRHDVQIKVNDWVLIATHPLSSATRKVVAKFKPKFEGPYGVLDVKNNNVVVWKAGKRLTINADQVRLYRHRKCDEAEIGTGSSDNGSLRDESSGFDRVQRRSNESQDGKKKGSEEKRELEEKMLSFLKMIRVRNTPNKTRPERKIQKGSEHRVPKRALSSNYKTNSNLPKFRKKIRREETVTPTTTGYDLRQRSGKKVESQSTIERKTQQGGPVRSRRSRGRNDSPYMEERTRSNNKNARRGGDQQWQDQERKGAFTRNPLSLEVLVGNANYMS
ncbi:uncharacterized protein TNCV_4126471 [Trichonephila clavipes]|nr:uncharacterized protein TNCV_4126471 [Trichonephila clavipes]